MLKSIFSGDIDTLTDTESDPHEVAQEETVDPLENELVLEQSLQSESRQESNVEADNNAADIIAIDSQQAMQLGSDSGGDLGVTGMSDDELSTDKVICSKDSESEHVVSKEGVCEEKVAGDSEEEPHDLPTRSALDPATDTSDVGDTSDTDEQSAKIEHYENEDDQFSDTSETSDSERDMDDKDLVEQSKQMDDVKFPPYTDVPYPDRDVSDAGVGYEADDEKLEEQTLLVRKDEEVTLESQQRDTYEDRTTSDNNDNINNRDQKTTDLEEHFDEVNSLKKDFTDKENEPETSMPEVDNTTESATLKSDKEHSTLESGDTVDEEEGKKESLLDLSQGASGLSDIETTQTATTSINLAENDEEQNSDNFMCSSTDQILQDSLANNENGTLNKLENQSAITSAQQSEQVIDPLGMEQQNQECDTELKSSVEFPVATKQSSEISDENEECEHVREFHDIEESDDVIALQTEEKVSEDKIDLVMTVEEVDSHDVATSITDTKRAEDPYMSDIDSSSSSDDENKIVKYPADSAEHAFLTVDNTPVCVSDVSDYEGSENDDTTERTFATREEMDVDYTEESDDYGTTIPLENESQIASHSLVGNETKEKNDLRMEDEKPICDIRPSSVLASREETAFQSGSSGHSSVTDVSELDDPDEKANIAYQTPTEVQADVYEPHEIPTAEINGSIALSEVIVKEPVLNEPANLSTVSVPSHPSDESEEEYLPDISNSTQPKEVTHITEVSDITALTDTHQAVVTSSSEGTDISDEDDGSADERFIEEAKLDSALAGIEKSGSDIEHPETQHYDQTDLISDDATQSPHDLKDVMKDDYVELSDEDVDHGTNIEESTEPFMQFDKNVEAHECGELNVEINSSDDRPQSPVDILKDKEEHDYVVSSEEDGDGSKSENIKQSTSSLIQSANDVDIPRSGELEVDTNYSDVDDDGAQLPVEIHKDKLEHDYIDTSDDEFEHREFKNVEEPTDSSVQSDKDVHLPQSSELKGEEMYSDNDDDSTQLPVQINKGKSEHDYASSEENVDGNESDNLKLSTSSLIESVKDVDIHQSDEVKVEQNYSDVDDDSTQLPAKIHKDKFEHDCVVSSDDEIDHREFEHGKQSTSSLIPQADELKLDESYSHIGDDRTESPVESIKDVVDNDVINDTKERDSMLSVDGNINSDSEQAQSIEQFVSDGDQHPSVQNTEYIENDATSGSLTLDPVDETLVKTSYQSEIVDANYVDEKKAEISVSKLSDNMYEVETDEESISDKDGGALLAETCVVQHTPTYGDRFDESSLLLGSKGDDNLTETKLEEKEHFSDEEQKTDQENVMGPERFTDDSGMENQNKSTDLIIGNDKENEHIFDKTVAENEPTLDDIVTEPLQMESKNNEISSGFISEEPKNVEKMAFNDTMDITKIENEQVDGEITSEENVTSNLTYTEVMDEEKTSVEFASGEPTKVEQTHFEILSSELKETDLSKTQTDQIDAVTSSEDDEVDERSLLLENKPIDVIESECQFPERSTQIKYSSDEEDEEYVAEADITFTQSVPIQAGLSMGENHFLNDHQIIDEKAIQTSANSEEQIEFQKTDVDEDVNLLELDIQESELYDKDIHLSEHDIQESELLDGDRNLSEHDIQDSELLDEERNLLEHDTQVDEIVDKDRNLLERDSHGDELVDIDRIVLEHDIQRGEQIDEDRNILDHDTRRGEHHSQEGELLDQDINLSEPASQEVELVDEDRDLLDHDSQESELVEEDRNILDHDTQRGELVDEDRNILEHDTPRSKLFDEDRNILEHDTQRGVLVEGDRNILEHDTQRGVLVEGDRNLLEHDTQRGELVEGDRNLLEHDTQRGKLVEGDRNILEHDTQRGELVDKDRNILEHDTQRGELVDEDRNLSDQDSQRGELVDGDRNVLDRDSQRHELVEEDRNLLDSLKPDEDTVTDDVSASSDIDDKRSYDAQNMKELPQDIYAEYRGELAEAGEEEPYSIVVEEEEIIIMEEEVVVCSMPDDTYPSSESYVIDEVEGAVGEDHTEQRYDSKDFQKHSFTEEPLDENEKRLEPSTQLIDNDYVDMNSSMTSSCYAFEDDDDPTTPLNSTFTISECDKAELSSLMDSDEQTAMAGIIVEQSVQNALRKSMEMDQEDQDQIAILEKRLSSEETDSAESESVVSVEYVYDKADFSEPEAEERACYQADESDEEADACLLTSQPGTQGSSYPSCFPESSAQPPHRYTDVTSDDVHSHVCLSKENVISDDLVDECDAGNGLDDGAFTSSSQSFESEHDLSSSNSDLNDQQEDDSPRPDYRDLAKTDSESDYSPQVTPRSYTSHGSYGDDKHTDSLGNSTTSSEHSSLLSATQGYTVGADADENLNLQPQGDSTVDQRERPLTDDE